MAQSDLSIEWEAKDHVSLLAGCGVLLARHDLCALHVQGMLINAEVRHDFHRNGIKGHGVALQGLLFPWAKGGAVEVTYG